MSRTVHYWWVGLKEPAKKSNVDLRISRLESLDFFGKAALREFRHGGGLGLGPLRVQVFGVSGSASKV